jgi:hypothetical protein
MGFSVGRAGIKGGNGGTRSEAGKPSNEAMNWLEKAYEERFNPGVLLRPGFDPLRSDPRFEDLVHRIGLPRTRRLQL